MIRRLGNCILNRATFRAKFRKKFCNQNFGAVVALFPALSIFDGKFSRFQSVLRVEQRGEPGAYSDLQWLVEVPKHSDERGLCRLLLVAFGLKILVNNFAVDFLVPAIQEVAGQPLVVAPIVGLIAEKL